MEQLNPVAKFIHLNSETVESLTNILDESRRSDPSAKITDAYRKTIYGNYRLVHESRGLKQVNGLDFLGNELTQSQIKKAFVGATYSGSQNQINQFCLVEKYCYGYPLDFKVINPLCYK
uniref:Uncharacterized protein n=1 Tax=Rhabditophanes sp. KR3021 TaxID=114890 RepID=A0AC35U0T9_9BILA